MTHTTRKDVGASGELLAWRPVLVVDDDPLVLMATARLLESAGFKVVRAEGGDEALAALAACSFAVVLSDINMPGASGLDILKAVRDRDLDVPVVLITGAPTLAGAAEAVAWGAFRYLVKPVDSTALVEVTAHAVRLHRIAQIKREALAAVSNGGAGVGERAALLASFERALASLWMAAQPILDVRDRAPHGYEMLLRSGEPALPHPGAVIDAAERLGRLHELGQAVRDAAARAADSAPPGAQLFVNLHSRDLDDPHLVDASSPLSRVAERVVLEVTERVAIDEVRDARARVADLRRLGFRVAIDDLGAGYSGLTSFAALEPEYVKLDMSLVRGIDSSPTRQRLVGALAAACVDLGVRVVAEGIETTGERDHVARLGCDLLQGYRFARPGPPFPSSSW